MGVESIQPLITYTNGLIIVVLLLVILLVLGRQLPKFCEACVHVKEKPGLTGYTKFCRTKCMYNPPYRGSVTRSKYYEKKKA